MMMRRMKRTKMRRKTKKMVRITMTVTKKMKRKIHFTWTHQ